MCNIQVDKGLVSCDSLIFESVLISSITMIILSEGGEGEAMLCATSCHSLRSFLWFVIVNMMDVAINHAGFLHVCRRPLLQHRACYKPAGPFIWYIFPEHLPTCRHFCHSSCCDMSESALVGFSLHQLSLYAVHSLFVTSCGLSLPDLHTIRVKASYMNQE